MKNALHPHVESLSASTDVEAEVLFVDLDYTLLGGAVVDLTDEELESAPLIHETLALILQAKGLGIPVVMVTRNNDRLIERFFAAKPDLQFLFDETIACPTGRKSDTIKSYLSRNRLNPKKALFIDDLMGERDDVERNTEGVRASHPDENFSLTKARANAAEEQREKMLERLKTTPYPEEREQIRMKLQSAFHMKAYEINLAA